MSCKGVCQHHKPNWASQTLRYANGQKRCVSCECIWHGMENTAHAVADYYDINLEL